MKRLVIAFFSAILFFLILPIAVSCIDYQALYLQKNSEVESIRSNANANAFSSSYSVQITALQQENANLKNQLSLLQQQYSTLANTPPQIHYVDKPIYIDRYVNVPVYVPTPVPQPPFPHSISPRPGPIPHPGPIPPHPGPIIPHPHP